MTIKKTVCLLLALVIAMSAAPAAFAEAGIYVITEQKVNRGSIRLNEPSVNGELLTLDGVHSKGSGYDITLKITDESCGTVYAVKETVSKSGGSFSFSVGLKDEAYGKNLTASICDAESGEISYIKLSCMGNVNVSDFMSVISTTNTDAITLDTPLYSHPSLVFGGTYTEGSGYDIQLSFVDAANSSAVYKTAKTTSKSGGKFSLTTALPSEAYDKEVILYVKCTDGSYTDEAQMKFVFSGGYAKNEAQTAESIAEIEELIAECEAKNISVEYEKVNLGVIKRFKGFLNDYITKGLTKEYEHNYNVICSLAAETIAALNGYLNGTKAEKAAPVYVSSDVTEDGQSLIGTVRLKGELVEQPLFFNGYGHWSDALTDYQSFTDLGINYTQYEIGPNSILKPGTGSNKYNIDTAAVQRVKNVFKTAEDNNLSVVFLTAMHYFPQFIYNQYPEIKNNGNGSFPDFMPYNPTHDEVKAALEAFLRAVIPEIKDYKSFHSVCLANEPFFVVSDYPDYYIGDYRAFLQQKYKTVSALNIAYDTNYQSFDEIDMPGWSVGAQYTDWREFNDSILTEWFTFLKDVVKDIDENIPVQVKCSAYISSGGQGRRRIFCGTNYEQWSPLMDLNGCDAWGMYGENADKLQGKTMWYDFMTSMKNAPVINSEDHILRDKKDITYNADEYRMNMADVWQGAIHGRAGAVYWIWDKSSRTQEGTMYYNANLSRRADHVAGIGKVNLDLNRLANEVTAIQRKPARCAILYSNHTQVGNNYHSAAMYEVYSRLLYNGEKVYIANDTYPEKINQNENLELLIVPACEYMPSEVWQEIKKFKEKGKTVIFAEVSDRYRAENGKALDTALVNGVLGGSTRVSFGGWDGDNAVLYGCQSVYNAIDNAVKDFAHTVRASAANGMTEWTAAEYDGDYVVNLCNYGDETTEISLTMNNEKIYGEIFDLTENEKISDSFALKPFETKLIRISTEDGAFAFRYSDGSEALSARNDALTSTVCAKAEANAGYAHIVAVYDNNNTLKNVICSKGTADENGIINSSVSIQMYADCSVSAYLLDGTDSVKPYLPTKKLGRQ